ncbi:hypothetical protein GDO86_014520 [Hymenochirus boettgeri]|uniref:DUF1279 domain-containing protein n=1 Tax=Hymenochirus boettgeri TaxID=247094 RepID=A0A8T2JUC5_9PIPI|nr:hypothetical protein GDO86_014520 [Hymenochirus boettgeri]
MLGLIVPRGSVVFLRPGLFGISGRWAACVRPDLWQDPRGVQFSFPAKPSCLPSAKGIILWANTAGTDPAQNPHKPQGSEVRDPTEDDEKKPNKTQQLKKVFKEYGAVAVSFHVGISLVSLGIFYVIVSSGIDVTSLLMKVGFSETVVQSKVAAGTSTFVLAYAIHKLFAPARISITLVSVPFIVRYLRKIGLFKPPSQTH